MVFALCSSHPLPNTPRRVGFGKVDFATLINTLFNTTLYPPKEPLAPNAERPQTVGSYLEQENSVNRQKLMDNCVQPVCTSSSRQVNPMGIAKVCRMSRFARFFTCETIYIVCYGFATLSCAGNNCQRSSTRCSRHCWVVSRPTTRRAGQRKYKRSLLLFREASHSAMVSDDYSFRLTSIPSNIAIWASSPLVHKEPHGTRVCRLRRAVHKPKPKLSYD